MQKWNLIYRARSRWDAIYFKYGTFETSPSQKATLYFRHKTTEHIALHNITYKKKYSVLRPFEPGKFQPFPAPLQALQVNQSPAGCIFFIPWKRLTRAVVSFFLDPGPTLITDAMKYVIRTNVKVRPRRRLTIYFRGFHLKPPLENLSRVRLSKGIIYRFSSVTRVKLFLLQ